MMLDPTDPRFETGTPEQQAQARAEYRRQQRIQAAMQSSLPEVPRGDLIFGKFGVIEDRASGNFYRAVRGDIVDPRFGSAVAYYLSTAGLPVYLERPVGAPQSRAELERQQAERERRNATPKPRPSRANQ